LIKDGVVEKVREPREQGERGRPSGRYRIKHWYSWGCMCVKLPASQPAGPDDPRWFLGTKIKRLGKEGVRMWPEEKKQFDQLFKEDESFRAAVLKARRDRRKRGRKKKPDTGP